MKKKIKIIKDNKSFDHGTFLNEGDSLAMQSSPKYSEDNKDGQSVVEKLDDKYKKKKVMNKKDIANRGLKYVNPSQRNHSSIYE